MNPEPERTAQEQAGPERAEPREIDLPEADRETAALLRAVLAREAERIRPTTRGPEEILRRARAVEPGPHPVGPGPEPVEQPATAELVVAPLVPRPRSRTGRIAHWLPAVAAAAVVAVVGTGIAGVRTGVIHAPMIASVVGASSRTSASTSVPAVPVYLLETEQGRSALVREYVPTAQRDPGRRLTEALRWAVSGGDDPDLTSAWRMLGLHGTVTGRSTAAGITVTLPGTLIGAGSNAGSGADATLARLAVQQLVWTATAVVGQDAPVRIDGPGPTSSLFGLQPLQRTFTRDTGSDDPRAPVWIDSVTQGQQLVVGSAVITGDALTTTTGTVDWTLGTVGSTTVTAGSVRLLRSDGTAPAVGERAGFTIRVTLPASGRYQLSVIQQWPSVSDSSATWTDTAVLDVR